MKTNIKWFKCKWCYKMNWQEGHCWQCGKTNG